MTNNGNGVNIARASTPDMADSVTANAPSLRKDGAVADRRNAYHHGDLRAAVLEAGRRRLAESGDAELGLRALARDVGVSATALYRHFPDKEALLDALADDGLRRLGELQAAAWAAAKGGPAGFRATGIAYVRFAYDEPALFRLSFTRQMSERAQEKSDGAQFTFDLLRSSVAEALPPGTDVDVAALHAWSLVHGLAMLILDRRVAWDEDHVAAVVDMTFGGPRGAGGACGPE